MVVYLDSGEWGLYSRYMDYVAGFTTNPSLMADGGVTQYTDWAKWVSTACVRNKPVSFEVFGDDLETMEREARYLSSIAPNVYVKIPITNTKGESTAFLIQSLSLEGIKLNITAITTKPQIELACISLSDKTPSIVSIFCGRIADTGRDPVPFIMTALKNKNNLTQVLWASAREVYNIKQARDAGADIITLSPSLLGKYLEMDGKDLNEVSLMTIKQFHEASKEMTF